MPAQGTVRDRGEAGLYLIETMRWEPQKGLLRRELHMERLQQSARALGFTADMADIERKLMAVEGGVSPQRVRLTLQRDGACAIETQPFTPQPSDTVWRLRIASGRLDSSDPLLRHKTSRRATYDAARAEYAAGDADEVLLLNERGDVCEGTITSVFLQTRHGILLTPPLESGLLAGVLRAEMIGQGTVEERVLRPADIATATGVLVGNSLRGLIKARLLPDDGR